MSRYLFVVPPFFGHISPTLSVGAALLSRGHEVMWAGLQGIASDRVPSGGTFVVLKSDPEELERILRRQDDGPSVGGAEVLKLALEETYIPLGRMMMRELPALAAHYQPDVIVNDCICFAGAFCAYLMGVRCVTTTPVPPDVMGSAMDMPRIREWQERLIRDLQRECGIYSDRVVIHSDLMNIVFTSKLFAGIAEPAGSLQFVGPVRGRPEEGDFDWKRLEESAGQRIFISLGTLLVDIRRAFFRKMVEAFRDQPVTIVAATDPAILEEWPENFIVQAYVPQARVLEKMDMVICHGGFNTVNDALLNELPILIIPIAYDHFHTASLIERAGCGISIRYKRLRIADVQRAADRLLEDKEYRQNAARVKESFRQSGGSVRAVELLEEVAGRPVEAAAGDEGDRRLVDDMLFGGNVGSNGGSIKQNQ